MINNRVFVSPVDVNYASSKTSATVNTALNPFDLADGAVGFYGIHRGNAVAANTGKQVLIIDGGSESAGVVPAATFLAAGGDSVTLFIGTATGANKQGVMDLTGLKVTTQAYVAPVKEVINLGWDEVNTANSLNLPSTILEGDEAVLKIVGTNDPSENDRTGDSYSGYARKDSDTTYNILFDLVKAVNLDDRRLADVDIIGDGTVTEATQDATVTNGSDIVTFAAGVTITAGAFFFVRNRIYQVAVGATAGTSITLDRVYRGATETIDVSATANLVGTVASTANYGLEVEQRNDDKPIEIAVDELIRSASKTTTTAYVEGNGTGAKVYQSELDARPLFGNLDNRSAEVPIKDLKTNQSLTYDQYYLVATNIRQGSDPHIPNNATSSTSEVTVAFPSTIADTGGKNQSDFEDILTALGVSVATLF